MSSKKQREQSQGEAAVWGSCWETSCARGRGPLQSPLRSGIYQVEVVLYQITQVVVAAAYGSRLEIPSPRTTHSLALRLLYAMGDLQPTTLSLLSRRESASRDLLSTPPPGWALCPISI